MTDNDEKSKKNKPNTDWKFKTFRIKLIILALLTNIIFTIYKENMKINIYSTLKH